MNKKAIWAILIALCIPLISYMLLRTAGGNAVEMPRKYLPDSTFTVLKDGKNFPDTIWHKTKNITLINHLGDTVNLADNRGKITVLNFFFTRCGSICPRLTRNMKKLQESFLKGGESRRKIDTSIVRFLSITIDPEHDTVATLKNYADRFGINPENWFLLTGNRDSIYKFAFEELKVDQFSTEKVTPEFVHTSRFVLLDKQLVVRGYYDGLNNDNKSLPKLSRDIGLLMMEKDKTKRSKIFLEIIDLKWLWLIVVLAVITFVIIFKRKS